jgi:DNA-directed RNA polymerase subunit alpha
MGMKNKRIFFLKIWTNESLTPKQALHEASHNSILLFIHFLHAEEYKLHLENNQYKVTLPLFTFHDRLTKLKKNKKEIALKSTFIDQSELPPRINYTYPLKLIPKLHCSPNFKKLQLTPKLLSFFT